MGERRRTTLWRRRSGSARSPTVARRASVLRNGEAHELTGTGRQQAPVGAPRPFLYDPDGAVIRAHLVAELAMSVDGTLADPRIAYTFTDAAAPTPFGRCFEVVAEVPFPLKRLRAALRSRGVGHLEIRKRGVAVDPDRLRHDLKLTGTESATLVLTRVADKPTAFLCQPGRPRDVVGQVVIQTSHPEHHYSCESDATCPTKCRQALVVLLRPAGSVGQSRPTRSPTPGSTPSPS